MSQGVKDDIDRVRGRGIGRGGDRRNDAGVQDGGKGGHGRRKVRPDIDLVPDRARSDEGKDRSGDRDRRRRHGLRAEGKGTRRGDRSGRHGLAKGCLQPKPQVFDVHRNHDGPVGVESVAGRGEGIAPEAKDFVVQKRLFAAKVRRNERDLAEAGTGRGSVNAFESEGHKGAGTLGAGHGLTPLDWTRCAVFQQD